MITAELRIKFTGKHIPVRYISRVRDVTRFKLMLHPRVNNVCNRFIILSNNFHLLIIVYQVCIESEIKITVLGFFFPWKLVVRIVFCAYFVFCLFPSVNITIETVDVLGSKTFERPCKSRGSVDYIRVITNISVVQAKVVASS